MRYYGGKSRIGKEISKIIIKLLKDFNIKIYIEPFCGALGVLHHIGEYQLSTKDIDINIYASDINKDLIMLWKEVQKEVPYYNITKNRWIQLKNSKSHSAERAFAGFGCSYRGQWFSGFIQDYDKKYNCSDVTYKSLVKIQSKIKLVEFKYSDYRGIFKKLLKNKESSVLVYCDIPYEGTENKFNQNYDNFDYIEFWNYVKKLAHKGIIILVSSYSAPPDFTCIFSKKINNGINIKHYQKKEIYDKLFIYNPNQSQVYKLK